MMKKILVGDVGGTNTTLGLFNTQKNTLTKIREYKTKDIDLEREILTYLDNEIEGISLAVAGVKHKDIIRMTNINKKISEMQIKKKTKLNTLILNDFEALGYYIKAKNKRKTIVIGAGTGLGKVIVLDDVISGEGGHEDFPFRKGEEKLKDFFYKKLKRAPEYEDLVSGRGITRIKEFYSKKKLSKNELEPKTIFSNKKDNLNKKAITEFSKFYGRFIKNSHIGFLTKEIFIAGGITRKNPDIINTKEFQKELKHRFIKTPKIVIIKDKYAGLKGAGYALNNSLIQKK